MFPKLDKQKLIIYLLIFINLRYISSEKCDLQEKCDFFKILLGNNENRIKNDIKETLDFYDVKIPKIEDIIEETNKDLTEAKKELQILKNYYENSISGNNTNINDKIKEVEKLFRDLQKIFDQISVLENLENQSLKTAFLTKSNLEILLNDQNEPKKPECLNELNDLIDVTELLHTLNPEDIEEKIDQVNKEIEENNKVIKYFSIQLMAKHIEEKLKLPSSEDPFDIYDNKLEYILKFLKKKAFGNEKCK